MRIVTLNTGGGRLLAPLLAFVREQDADVWCFQEVTRPGEPSPAFADYVDGDVRIPQRTDLFADFAAALPGHDGVFAPAASGELAGDGGRTFVSHFGLATFVRAGLPVIGQVVAFVHGGYAPDGWGDHPRPRNAHGLRIHDPIRRRAVSILQVHGLRDPAGKHDTPARLRQAEAVAGLVERLRASSAEATVVCGDFNVLPDSATFRVLARLGLDDLVAAHGVTDTRTSLYPGRVRHADYVLTGGAARVARFEVVAEPEVSDHRPLLVDLA